MSLSSRIFFCIFLLALGTATALSYYCYMVLHDYLVEGEAPPEEEQRAVIIPLPSIE
ncbi:MAG: hypothetical protein UY50_C0009G0047 [Parcubacteria group bacterium GW2011_GWA2_49_9]|nr:MAG: hypothetical protein UY50_C0009G0047 [Parcubacteria group bacterium GW2011_GWA2_49_9]